MAMALTLATSRISGRFVWSMEGNTLLIPRLSRESHGYGERNKTVFIDATRNDKDSLG